MKTESNLEKVLSAGHLAVTSECGPPRGASAETVVEKAKYLEGVVDAVNITDNQTAMVRMSSFARFGPRQADGDASAAADGYP